jgi:hypothetical protein
MSTKKQLPEHVATQIASQPGPGAGSIDRRTAALPQAPVPTAAPNARTMSFDRAQIAAGAGARPRETASRIPQATVISTPERAPESPRPRPRSSTRGRWVGGPIVALIVAILTSWVAGLVNPAHSQTKNVGRLRLSTDPEGAAVLVDGKVQPKVTPTLIEGEIGATLHVIFKLDGYLDKDAEVYVSEGERPFRAKLDHHDIAAPAPDMALPLAPTPVNLDPTPRAVPSDHNTRKKNRDHAVSVAPTPSDPIVPALGSTGTLSVHVLPWAIVYVDGAKIRQTPLDAQPFAAGMHVVELSNEQLHKKEKINLQIRANGHEEIRRDWER